MTVVFSVPGVVSAITGTGGRNVAMDARAVELGRLPKPSLPIETRSTITLPVLETWMIYRSAESHLRRFMCACQPYPHLWQTCRSLPLYLFLLLLFLFNILSLLLFVLMPECTNWNCALFATPPYLN